MEKCEIQFSVFSSQFFADTVRIKSSAAVFTTFSHIADIVDKTN